MSYSVDTKEDFNIIEEIDCNEGPTTWQWRSSSAGTQPHHLQMSSNSKLKRSPALRGSSSAGDLRDSPTPHEANGVRCLVESAVSYNPRAKSIPLLNRDAKPSSSTGGPPRLTIPQRRHLHIRSISTKTASPNSRSSSENTQLPVPVSQTVKNPIHKSAPSEFKHGNQRKTGYAKLVCTEEMVPDAPYHVQDSLPAGFNGLQLPESIETHPPANASLIAEQHGSATAEESLQNVQSPAMHTMASCTSLRSSVQATSIQSGASRSSAYRHALLKPSIMASQPIDMGLPVQPVLTTGTINPKSETLRVFAGGRGNGDSFQAPAVALSNILHHARLASSDTESRGMGSADNDVEARYPDQTKVASSVDRTEKARNESVVLGKAPHAVAGPTCGPGAKTVISNPMLSASELANRPGNDSKDQAPVLRRNTIVDPLSEVAWTAIEYSEGNSPTSVPSPTCNRIEDASHVKDMKPPKNRDRRKSFLPPSIPQPLVSDSSQLITARGNEITGVNLAPAYSNRRTSVSPRGKVNIVNHPEVANHILAKFQQSEDYQPAQSPSICLDRLESDRNMVRVPGPKGEHFKNNGLQHPLNSNGSSLTSQKDIPSRNTSKKESLKYEVLEKLAQSSDSQLSLKWLRELLSDHEPYATRLTAIPPRKHRHANRSSKTGPDSSFLTSGAKKPGKDAEARASENFTRTINDLEILLSEALHIARQAAESEADEDLPDLLGDATAVLQDGRKYLENELMKKATANLAISRPIPPMQSSSLDSLHESARFTSITGSYGSDGSLDYEHEYYSHAPPRSARSSISDGSDLRVIDLPANERPKQRKPSWIANLASKATTFSRKGSNVKSSGRPATSDMYASRDQKQSRVLVRPSVRDGNMELAYVRTPEAENDVEARIKHHHEGERRIPKIKSSSSQPKFAGKAAVNNTIRIPPYKEDNPNRIRSRKPPNEVQNRREVTEFIRVFHQPPIQSRQSSLAIRKPIPTDAPDSCVMTSAISQEVGKTEVERRSTRSRKYRSSLSSNQEGSELDFSTPPALRDYAGPVKATSPGKRYELKDPGEGVEILPKRHISGRRLHEKIQYLKHDRFSHLNLRGKSHISLRESHGFSLSRSHRRQPIARDWSPGRKRFAASVACISTALIGILIGIYAGEVPSIQYYIADFYHYAILGNVILFISLAISTFLFWPLPLLHGRKPYTLTAMTIAMPLLFPQAIAVSMQRSPYVPTYRIGLILPRALMGFALGFANMNFLATLTDLFGASLQSANPHQETVNENDVRRHGGGLGVWLGIWTWCYMGSIGVGFMIGAVVINDLSPDWGFYISIVIIAAVLFLNVVTPEVRRSAFRRSVTEVKTSTTTSHRVARGEVMMHRLQTGPKWWGQEFHQGVMLSLDMMRQPGFVIMSVYVAWIYGQIVLVIVLLGSLMSKYYRFTSPIVGLTTMAIPLGALLAVPFQKASLFSRARRHAQRTDSGTFETRVTITSHLIRRAIFTLVLPFAGLAYTLSSGGPPTPFILPILFAGVIGFLSNLAIAECNGIIMEAFDVSDLQPGMTGRPRGASGEATKDKRTNYSSFPRISSAFAIVQSLGFLIGATATGVGGVVEREIGQKAATGVMAGILLILTIGVLGVLYRWKEVQIVPAHRAIDMEKWEKERLINIKRREVAAMQGIATPEQPELDEPWRPVIIGNPSGKTRRMSILELGHLSRWSEIRRRNKLVDESAYEGRHPNMSILRDVKREIQEKNLGSLRRNGSKRSRMSQMSEGSEDARA